MRCQSKQHLQPFHTCIGTPQVTQFMQQSQEQKHIRPGPNGEMFAPAPSTFCITWINPHYPSTTLLQPIEHCAPTLQVHKACLAHRRVCAKEYSAVGMGQVWDRMDEWTTMDNLSPSELVVAILAPGRKNIASS
jgi:hypothetical protein